MTSRHETMIEGVIRKVELIHRSLVGLTVDGSGARPRRRRHRRPEEIRSASRLVMRPSPQPTSSRESTPAGTISTVSAMRAASLRMVVSLPVGGVLEGIGLLRLVGPLLRCVVNDDFVEIPMEGQPNAAREQVHRRHGGGLAVAVHAVCPRSAEPLVAVPPDPSLRPTAAATRSRVECPPGVRRRRGQARRAGLPRPPRSTGEFLWRCDRSRGGRRSRRPSRDFAPFLIRAASHSFPSSVARWRGRAGRSSALRYDDECLSASTSSRSHRICRLTGGHARRPGMTFDAAFIGRVAGRPVVNKRKTRCVPR